MIGQPKYHLEQEVSFMWKNKKITGTIYIIDAYGTYDQHKEVSYDILASDKSVLYKHILESSIIS